MKLMVQGVGGGANLLLFATFLRLHHPNGETEEEDCQEQRQIGGRRHFEACETVGCSVETVLRRVFWEKGGLAKAKQVPTPS